MGVYLLTWLPTKCMFSKMGSKKADLHVNKHGSGNKHVCAGIQHGSVEFVVCDPTISDRLSVSKTCRIKLEDGTGVAL